ncbi:YggT family protein [Aliiglaciecola sp. CAU 1673]|uniref:YggT family protein n=1 Tax=Aliiglaciecola sp. CAU 1673 TaxID=3032595 RepID=UPI0023DAB0DD|nr:YggT family protein [Aliiglaciecola sp. CAU 1673]MDF2179501.1 YggT family protein [Aliiglaciecola sp. CAU 1673]
MNSMHFLVSILFDLYLMVVLLRLWLQLARADFYNPFSQFVVKATHPIVGPLRRVLPSLGNLDTATLVLALLVAATKVFVISLMMGGMGINPLNLLTASLLIVVKEMFSLAFWVLILRAILSWVSQGRTPIDLVLYQLTEPMLAPIRRIIPPIGGLDLSVLVAIIALQFLQILMQDLLGYM